jgi:hypothetical protein
MNKRLKNNGRLFLALLLTAVLTGTLLIKPAHILLVHHELTEISTGHSDGTTVANSHQQDCPICDFEFCSFISSSVISVPKVAAVFAAELTPCTIDRPVDQSSHHFQLRAPPVA